FEASPPWLRKKHPEIVRTDNFGRIHGARGLHCKNNKTFIQYVDRLTNKMAAHYANHEAVIGWQIDNELRNVECYCPDCREGFIKWLQDRYGTLEKLNETWGTKFWSQVYNSWDEVDRKSTRLNSSHVKISYAVFCLKKKKTKNTIRYHNDDM